MSQQQLIEELSQIKHDSIFAHAVRSNPGAAIEMIRAQAKDNRVLVCEIIGENLVTIIESL